MTNSQEELRARENRAQIATTYVRIALTQACNHECFYCYKEGRIDRSPRSLSTSDYVTLFEAAATLGIEKIRFTGGEPFLHRDLPSLIAEASRFVAEVGVTTNGSLLLEFQERVLRSMTDCAFNVTLPALSPQLFRDLCGADHPDRVVAGIRRLAECGCKKLKINVPLLRSNANELPAIVQLARDVGAKVKLANVLGIEGSDYLSISDIESELLGQGADRVSFEEFTLFGVHLELKQKFWGQKCVECNSPCQEGYATLRIQPDGAVWPCLGRQLGEKLVSGSSPTDMAAILRIAIAAIPT